MELINVYVVNYLFIISYEANMFINICCSLVVIHE